MISSRFILINKQHDASSAAAEIKALSQDKLRELACRPGSVAWQRTLMNSATGHNVFAVDGTVLQPNASYIGSLRSPEFTTPRLRIGANDQWLHAPFGSAILFEPEEIAKAARSVVDAALAIIDGWRPKLDEELRYICKDVQFIRDPTANPDKIVSFSDNVVPGALYLLERLYPIVEATDLKVVSPW